MIGGVVAGVVGAVGGAAGAAGGIAGAAGGLMGGLGGIMNAIGQIMPMVQQLLQGKGEEQAPESSREMQHAKEDKQKEQELQLAFDQALMLAMARAG